MKAWKVGSDVGDVRNNKLDLVGPPAASGALPRRRLDSFRSRRLSLDFVLLKRCDHFFGLLLEGVRIKTEREWCPTGAGGFRDPPISSFKHNRLMHRHN